MVLTHEQAIGYIIKIDVGILEVKFLQELPILPYCLQREVLNLKWSQYVRWN